MCGAYKHDIRSLKFDGAKGAAIEGRSWYVDLENGAVLSKATNEPLPTTRRDGGNPLTAGMMLDEVWERYTPTRKSSSKSKTARSKRLYAVYDEDGDLYGTYTSLTEARNEASEIDGQVEEYAA